MATKTAPMNMRVDPSVRNIIDTAANLLNLDRSVFIQQVALSKAREVISNQRDFYLNDKAFEAFDQKLNDEPKTNKGMENLLSRKSPWE